MASSHSPLPHPYLFTSLRPYFIFFLVFPKPRQIETESALYDAAIKILMRRAHSVSEMKKALIRRTADEDLIQKVLARLKQNGYIDDARYAKPYAPAASLTGTSKPHSKKLPRTPTRPPSSGSASSASCAPIAAPIQ